MTLKQAPFRADTSVSLSKHSEILNGSDSGCYFYLPDRIQTHSKESKLAGVSPYERKQLVAHFWARVDQRGLVECWPWRLSRTGKGSHGQYTYRVGSKQYHFYAHRIAWMLTHDEPAGDLKVCHHCDNPPCCNPSHLFIGTQADNLNDARQKGRLVDGLAARKLSDDAYREILDRNSEAFEMACKYGVSLQHVWRIRRGHSGSTYRNSLRNVVPVRSVQLPVLGDVA